MAKNLVMYGYGAAGVAYLTMVGLSSSDFLLRRLGIHIDSDGLEQKVHG